MDDTPIALAAPTQMRPAFAARPSAHEFAAWALAALALLTSLLFHLLPALLGGLLVYELVRGLAPLLRSQPIEANAANAIVVAGIGIIVVASLSVLVLASAQFFTSDAGNVTALMQRLALILDNSRDKLPAWVAHYLPNSADDLRLALTDWLRTNAGMLKVAGADGARILVHALIGMVIGAMVALNRTLGTRSEARLAAALTERAVRLSSSFSRVVFAQIRIAGINAAFTAVYLLGLLPLLGINLPLLKTMVLATFVLGLIPVVGNLASNAIIVIVSLSTSLFVALGSLAFLVVIHKFEYFLNARIIGSRIKANAWELLIAILVMEAVFGLPGVIAAPIFYAYLKDELACRGLV